MISVGATDNVGIASVTLSYQKPGDPTVFIVPMSHASGNVWQGTISRTLLWQSEGHVTYWAQAVDTSGNQSNVVFNDEQSQNNWLYHSLNSCSIG